MKTIQPIPPDSKARAYLAARGIDIEPAAASGWLSWSNDHAEMFMRLGINGDDESWHGGTIFCDEHKGGSHERRRRKPRLLELLSFPVHGAANAWMNKAFLDADSTDISGKGFRVTYGTRKPIFIPPETWDARKDATTAVFLVEGPVKALALQQAGLMAIGLNGTWTSEAVPDKEKLGLKGYQRQKQLFAALREFNWFGRAVYLVFDADQCVNKGVRHSIVRSFILFHVAGADVRQLTTWDLQEAKGIDDLLIARGGREKAAEILKELKEKAPPFVETLDKQKDGVFVTREMRNVAMAPVQFETLKDDIAKATGIGKRTLGKSPSGDKPKKDKSGVEPVRIPPTAKPWDEPVEAEEALGEICEAIKRFVWIKPSQCLAAALWIVLSYLHDAADILPILLVTSPEENCGKSTLVKLIHFLANRSIIASRISGPAIYRTIRDDIPTMVLDEADTYMQENEILRGVIDSGHDRAEAFVILSIKDSELTGQFSTWCPKCIAQLGLPKRTILSRSIHVRMIRKSADNKTEKLRMRHRDEYEDLRRKISRLANDIREKVRNCEDLDDVLINRAGDNWQSLFIIARIVGKECLEKTIKAAKFISQKDAKESKSLGHYLLESLSRIITHKRKALNLEPAEKFFLPTQELLTGRCGESGEGDGLNWDEEAPWNEKGEGLTATKLAKELKKYDVEIEPVSARKGEKVHRGYWSDVIEKIIKQFVSNK